MRAILICLIFALAFNSAFASWFSDLVSNICQKCPSPQTVVNFDANRYLGKWYEITRAGDLWYEDKLKCVSAVYSLNSDGSVHVFNSGVNLKTNAFEGVNGTAVLTEPNTGKLKVSFKILNGIIKTNGNYWVIDTDYAKYSLVYSCETYLCFFKTEATWILSRDKTIDPSIQNRLTTALQGFSPLHKSLKAQDQSC